jgi:hypothetical protein
MDDWPTGVSADYHRQLLAADDLLGSLQLFLTQEPSDQAHELNEKVVAQRFRWRKEGYLN